MEKQLDQKDQIEQEKNYQRDFLAWMNERERFYSQRTANLAKQSEIFSPFNTVNS